MNDDQFYENNADQYFEQTFHVDPAPFVTPLTTYIAPGARILDVGCGSGRDMLWLAERGYICSGLECSSRLAALARSHTGLPVIEADFATYAFQGLDLDALLLVGALVHVPHARLPDVLRHICGALRSGGTALVTLKQGPMQAAVIGQREFFLWQYDPLMRIFATCGLHCLEYHENQSQVRASDLWMSFVLRKAA